MNGSSKIFPPLYITACIIFGIGIIGVGCIFILQLPSHIFKGMLYICLGLIAFGIGENVNHPKTLILTPGAINKHESPRYHRTRNACSFGNLIDIGALLLIFTGLSVIIFPQ